MCIRDSSDDSILTDSLGEETIKSMEDKGKKSSETKETQAKEERGIIKKERGYDLDGNPVLLTVEYYGDSREVLNVKKL